MESIQNLLHQIQRMQWSDYLDIAVVAFLIYKILPLIKTPSTTRIAKAVVAVLIIAWLTDFLHLYTVGFIMNQFLAIGLLALVILFQPELRRMLDHLGSVKLTSIFGVNKPVQQEMDAVITQTVRACEAMGREKVGALIVFAREQRLEEYFKTGTQIDGQVSEQLIRNIFFKNSPLHDGAMIIRDGRVAAAGCVLPLSDSNRLSSDLGTRHRAGVGMSEAFVKNELFRPFTQEKSDARTQYKGTGLGMSIVKELLNKLDGSIQVSSTLGQGTTFAFRLPFAVDTQDEETQALISTDKSCKLAGVQVLLVEDNEINMEIAEFYLTERGAAVAKAWNGREAVEKVKAEPRRFDVVLMDVMMPVLDGLAATREIRALPYPAAGVPILAMTAQDTRESAQECKDAGMNDYLAKPVGPDRMAEKILHWTRQQAETSSPAQPAAT